MRIFKKVTNKINEITSLPQKYVIAILKEAILWAGIISVSDLLIHANDTNLFNISLYSFSWTFGICMLLIYITTVRHRRSDKLTLSQQHAAEEKSLSLERILNLHAITSSTDIAGKIIAANKNFSKISGYSQDELIGKTHRLLKSGEHSNEFYERLWDTISSGGTWKGDLCNKNKSGELYWVKTTIIPRRDLKGKHIGYDRSSTDITELKNRQAKLNAALLSKSTFLSQMSHELRTPLNAIIGFAHVLEEQSDTLNEDEKKDFLSNIKLSGIHLVALIGNILDFNKLEMGKTELDLSPVFLSQLVDTCYSTFELQCKEANIALHVFCPNPQIQCLIDITAVNQVMFNLISNAIKFTHNGSIMVDFDVTNNTGNTSHLGNKVLTCSVEDNGKGIEPDKLDHIFDEFTQEDNTILRAHGGTGLGLSISKKLSDLMLGTIDLTSEVGKGSTFTMAIPVIEIKAIPTISNKPAIIDQGPVTVSTKVLRLLIVDDLEINRLVLRALLKPYGCHVDDAANGEKAVSLVTTSAPYDVVLMDLHMPIMGGLLATAAIRMLDDKEKAMVNIIAVTADAQKEVMDQCMEAGMNSVITKPVIGEVVKKLMADLQ
jgi:PAS domain S-box-containing protein